jgi:hypothetical protein
MRSIAMFAVVVTLGFGVISAARADVDRLGRGYQHVRSDTTATGTQVAAHGGGIRSGVYASVSEVLARRPPPAGHDTTTPRTPVSTLNGDPVDSGRFATVKAYGRT